MRSASLVAAALIAASATAPASAAVADPDAFANGADISNGFAGVTLRTVRTGDDVSNITEVGSVFAVNDTLATTGRRVFGQTGGNGTWGNGQFEYLEAIFANPIASVSLDFFANDGDDANAQLLAFDGLGNQIDIDAAASVLLGSPVTLTVTGTGIRSVRAYWDEVNRSENGGLDNLVFNAGAVVPEPASWAMMIAGFGLAGAAMRRARPRFATA